MKRRHKGDGKMKTGKMNTSRKESNFVCRMSPEDREQYLKRFMASCNPEELIPFIEITKNDKYFREIEYVINIPNAKRIEEESDQIILEKTDKINELENELTGYKLSNQALSNALDKEIHTGFSIEGQIYEWKEKAERYEKALKDIAINCDNPSFRVVAKMALENKK
jgi:hypothetical protein